MINLKDIKRIYFLGIGGIGMSALARYFYLHGKSVSGYDKTRTVLTAALEDEGIFITYEDNLDTLDKQADLIIYTPAIPKDHIQYNWFLENNYTLLKRAQVLGLAANEKFNISIAGSHGKTSVSSITAHILKTGNKDVAAFLGGICINFNSNFIDGIDYAVVEADEFDRSFLSLEPNIALITSVDTDHLDVYGNLEAIEDSFRQFCDKIREGGLLIRNSRVNDSIQNTNVRNLQYSIDNTSADYHIKNLEIQSGAYSFDVQHPDGVLAGVKSYYGGRHNIENALGAIAIALQTGVSEVAIKEAVASFKGVKRRFETHVRSNSIVYIDDYAHHPRELDATISSIKELYPGRSLTVIFQPHLFSRTKDLCQEFALSLSNSDSLILLDIYPAREEPIEGVSSKIIFDAVTITDKIMARKEQITELLSSRENLDIVLTVGAGDIDTKVGEIATLLKSRIKS